MGFIHCCGALRRSLTYSLTPQEGYLIAEADVLECCPVCGHYIVQLTRIDFEHEVSSVRKSNMHARRLFSNIKTSILYLQKYRYSPLNSSKSNFYLSYNEYGVKKRCYSNLSTMQIGKHDNMSGFPATNPILNTRSFRKVTLSQPLHVKQD